MDKKEFLKFIDTIEDDECGSLLYYLLGYFADKEEFKKVVIQRLDIMRKPRS